MQLDDLGNTFEFDEFWFPTVCTFPSRGLRLFATTYLVDERGIARERGLPYSKSQLLQEGYEHGRQRYGLDSAKSCVTVRLTSNKNSTVKA